MRRLRIGEAVQQMRRLDEHGEPSKFDVVICQYDGNRKTGGERTFYKGAWLKPQKNERLSSQSTASSRQPSHGKNYTLNLRLPNGKIRKVNRWLIEEFNGQKVGL